MHLSIRWRLTLWYTLALAVVLAGFSGLIYALLAHALHEQIDEVLLAQLQLLEHNRQDQRMQSHRHAHLAHLIDEFKEHANVFCVAYDSHGQVYERSEQLAADSLPPPRVVGHGQRHSENVTLPLIGRQRVLATGFSLGDEEFTVLLMAGLEDVDRELRQLLVVLGMAGPAALLVAGGLGYALARKAMAPLDELDRLTQQITAERLDRRLPVANPGDELGRLAKTINAMIGRLERSFAEIRRFTADASHELRTPLTAIRTEAEVALSKPISGGECQDLLGSILEECERLTRLTDQLLTLFREDAGSGRPMRAAVDLAAVVERVVETMRPLAEAKNIRLVARAKDALRVHGDEERLRQVFYNLLDNAIKYTPEGGTVEVRLERSDGAAKVTVRDTGIGIPVEHLPHVFERFYRVDKARSRAEGGTGLGLSIVQSLVAAHGGGVELASTPGQGTTCTVRLPVESMA
jgi:heavy metal sensor kinase